LCYADNPWTVVMDGSKEVDAVFSPIVSTVRVIPDTTQGSVVSGEEFPFIHCDDSENSICIYGYSWDASITLKAEPKPGYAFSHWEENGITVSTEREYCFLVEGSRELVPVFEEFRLGFPLEDRVPYITEGQTAATVTAVMDHSLSGGYYTLDGRNSEIETYNGLVANGTEHDYGNGVYCYDIVGITPFSGIKYYYIYPEENRSEICYDEHSGYDFDPLIDYNPNQIDPDDGQLGNGHDILATADGKLYKDTTGIIYGISGWNSYHAFYINHENGYYTWYLHCGRLTADIEDQIQTQGYADVTQGQHIAEVAGYGPDGLNTYPDHLHFEIRLNGINPANLIDPYGENLWE